MVDKDLFFFGGVGRVQVPPESVWTVYINWMKDQQKVVFQK